MGQVGLQELNNYLHEHVGDDYHGLVECLNEDGLEHREHFLRTDIQEHYTDEDWGAMTQEAVLRSLEESHLESIYQLGDRLFTVEYFQYTALVFIAISESRAIVIGLEPDPELNHTAIALASLDLLEE